MEKRDGASLAWHGFAGMPAPLLYEVLRFRQAIFVVEQKSPYQDLDGLDPAARHLLLHSDGALCGCLRLVPEPARIRIGRIAVAPQRRRQGFGRVLIEEALAVHRRDHPGLPIAISAQAPLMSYYARFGFAAVSGEYDDAGVTHIDMVRSPPA